MDYCQIKSESLQLNEVLGEIPPNEVVVCGLHLLLSYAFYFSLRDQPAACRGLQKLGHSFSSKFQGVINTLNDHLCKQSQSLKDWSQLNLSALLQKPPSTKKIKQWNNALKELQGFFKKNVAAKGVYQELQYYKLMISFAQNNAQIEDLFTELDVELHRRFSHALVLAGEHLWKEGKHEEALGILKKAQCSSFKDRGIIQNFGHFLSFSFSSVEEQIGVYRHQFLQHKFVLNNFFLQKQLLPLASSPRAK